MKILLIEDDRKMAEGVASFLISSGHDIEISDNGKGGLARAKSGGHTALVVDRMLPELDGLSLVRMLRDDGIETPVLLLTTMGGINDRVDGLESGADDYLCKPFANAELLARINAVTRRVERQEAAGPAVIRSGNIEMDLIRRSVSRGGRPIELQPQEFRLLEYLLRNAGKTVTRAMLRESVWEMHFDPRTNIVETHMSRLRAKLDNGTGQDPIQTIRGAGYVLRAP